MPDITLRAVAPDHSPDAAFDVIADFAQFPALVPDVINELTVTADRGYERTSQWSVAFHGGTLQWTETDYIHVINRRVDFRQTSGDLTELQGSWQVSEGPTGTVICFHAQFDLGMPAVADIIDPIAVTAFESTVESLLSGLLGDTAEIRVEKEVGVCQ